MVAAKVYPWEIFKIWSCAKVYFCEINEYRSSAEVNVHKKQKFRGAKISVSESFYLKVTKVTVDTKFTVGITINY